MTILAMMALDPIHNGHVAFLKKGLEVAETLDVYLSKRSGRGALLLPYAVRREALEAVEFDDGLTVLGENPGMLGLETDGYSGLLMGSDLANSTYSGAQPGFMDRFYRRFDRLFIVQRVGCELTDVVHERLPCSEVEVFDPVSDISATNIRRLIRQEMDVKPFIPELAYPIIEPYFGLIKDGTG